MQGHARFSITLQVSKRLKVGIHGQDRTWISKHHVSVSLSTAYLASLSRGSGERIKSRGKGRVSELVLQRKKAGIFTCRNIHSVLAASSGIRCILPFRSYCPPLKTK